MTVQVWDAAIGGVRDATPEEEAEILARANEPAASVPDEVSRRAGLQALLLEGVTEAMVEAKIEELLTSPDKEMALIEFRASQVFIRQRPLVIQIGTALGLDLDALFIRAAALP
jgi:hypothetical protein